jgi:NADH-quinone oxidoreductase subunit L
VILWAVGTVAAGLTAFHMFRMLFRAFWGPEPEGGYAKAPHPSGWAMSVPVAVLAVLSVVGGWIQVPGGWHAVTDWLDPVLAGAPELEATTAGEVATVIASAVAALIGIGVAWWLYVADPRRRERLAGVGVPARAMLDEAYRFDAVYDAAVVDTTRELGDVLRDRVEPAGVQGLVTAAVRTSRAAAAGLRAAQTGLVRTYAFAILAGVVALGAVVAAVIS